MEATTYQWDKEETLHLKGERLKEWRRKQVRKVKHLFHRADQITGDMMEKANTDLMEWEGYLPAYPKLYKKEDWEAANQYPMAHIMEEFHGALKKYSSGTTALWMVQKDLEAIEAWEDI